MSRVEVSPSGWRGSRTASALVLVGAVVCVAWIASVVAGCGDGGSQGTNPIEPTDESIAIGAMLFENNCQVCHGPDGRGSELAPDLTIHIPTREDGFLFRRITEGFSSDEPDRDEMPAFGDLLTEDERWHLVNFLRDAFGETAPVLPDDASSMNAAAGLD